MARVMRLEALAGILPGTNIGALQDAFVHCEPNALADEGWAYDSHMPLEFFVRNPQIREAFFRFEGYIVVDVGSGAAPYVCDICGQVGAAAYVGIEPRSAGLLRSNIQGKRDGKYYHGENAHFFDCWEPQ